ncbi:MAG: PoNi-like cognate immunity protein, partial [Alistipes sp.]|nr:PoNi-like cognate immunity protein [Alistipes sp.]
MRDTKCDKEFVQRIIKTYGREINDYEGDIAKLDEAIKNNIQLYRGENEEVLFLKKCSMFRYIDSWICGNYSCGCECAELEEMYLRSIPLIREIGIKDIGYVNFLEFFTLGILLEVPNETLEVLVRIADEEELDDKLFDFFVSACQLKRKMVSHTYRKATPYGDTEEIISLAQKDPVKATTTAENYMNKKWLRGHSDYGWTKAHKELGYVGFWSFETAALMKILKLSDENLKGNENYPYDLAHYKNGRRFTVGEIQENQEAPIEEIQEEYVYGIPLNEDLEELIPVCFHEYVNQLIEDYYVLDGRTFWEKYELNRIWYFYEDYISKNCDMDWLGHIIVFKMTDKGYILQLDCN